jgi:hypothetical protein
MSFDPRVFVGHSNANWAAKIKKMLATLTGGKEVAVGFPRGLATTGAKVYPTGATVLQVAVWNNFGAPRVGIRARPFMQQAVGPVNRAAKGILDQVTKAVRKKGTGLTPEQMDMLYKALGQAAQGEVRNVITNGNFVPNSPATIARKKSSKPLIDKGIMRKSVAYVIRDKT